jgi:hypothetical protein
MTVSITSKTREKWELSRRSLTRTWTGVPQEEVSRVNVCLIFQEEVFFGVKEVENALKKGALRLWATDAEEPDEQACLFSES